MSETPSPLSRSDVAINLGRSRLGRMTNTPGQSFSLADVYDSRRTIMVGADAFTEVYFKTRSGNIYRLDGQGRLINGNESKRTGMVVGQNLPPDQLAQQRLTVGEEFRFGQGNTTSITEIVAATSRQYASDYLNEITSGRTNSIIADFKQGLPSIPDNKPGHEGMSES